MRRTSNPAFKESYFQNEADYAGNYMTINGTISKIGILGIILIFAASFSWRFAHANPAFAAQYLLITSVFTFVIALITTFKPTFAAVTAPIYALTEGYLLGSISAIFNMEYEGIPLMALLLTIATLFSMLVIYKTKVIPVTEKLKAGIITATAGIAITYLLSFVLSFFGIQPFFASSGPLGIGISLVLVAVAAFNLILDFDFIVQGSENRAPAHMEWYAAFSIMVTLIWLYLEILRLLAKTQSRKR